MPNDFDLDEVEREFADVHKSSDAELLFWRRFGALLRFAREQSDRVKHLEGLADEFIGDAPLDFSEHDPRY